MAGTLTYLDELRWLLETHPAHFQAFRNLIDGRSDGVTDKQVDDLFNWCFIEHGRIPDPVYKPIIEASYRETPDGPCLVTPFDFKDTAEAAKVEQLEQEQDRRAKESKELFDKHLADPEKAKDMLRWIANYGKDKGKDRPR